MEVESATLEQDGMPSAASPAASLQTGKGTCDWNSSQLWTRADHSLPATCHKIQIDGSS